MKKAYDQAEVIFENHFLDFLPKIVFYHKTEEMKNGFDDEIEMIMKDIGIQIRKGNQAESLQKFRECLSIQDKHGFSANAIKNVGILVASNCENLLEEYNKKLYEITELSNNITQKIYACHLQTEFQTILEEIIQKLLNISAIV